MELCMTTEINIDALIPAEMARRAEIIGVRKAEMAGVTMFSLSVLAGAFIGLGANFSTVASTGASTLPYGIGRLLAGSVFCLGLILVVVGGAELFTGNNLIIMAWANRKVSTRALLRNWAIVYLGNFVGSFGTAFLAFLSQQYAFSAGGLGVTALRTAIAKSSLDFIPAIALGILCNALVCLAVWMSFGARSTTDKIAAIIFPITAFVAAGFEHSIANMYFIPMGLLIKGFAPEFMASQVVMDANLNLDALNWGAFFLNNLLPVTIGNIIGGGVLVAAIYWSIFLRKTG
jgi:formate/nitrite transporter